MKYITPEQWSRLGSIIHCYVEPAFRRQVEGVVLDIFDVHIPVCSECGKLLDPENVVHEHIETDGLAEMKIIGLERALHQSKCEIDSLRLQLEQHNKDRDKVRGSLQARIAMYQTEMNGLCQRIAELEEQLEESGKYIEALRAENAQLRESTAPFIDCVSAHEHYEKVASLKLELEKLRNTIANQGWDEGGNKA